MISAPVADPVERQGGRDRDRHAGGGDHVAALGGGRVRALADADDEEDEGDDVGGADEVGVGRERREGGHRTSSPVSALPDRLGGERLGRAFFERRLRLADEHAEHPVGDHEAADDVDRAEGDRDRADRLLERVVGVAEHDQAAEHDDAVDRVGLRHQRRVQGRRHLRDHLEADEGGEHEDRDLGHQVHQAAARGFLRSLVLDLALVGEAGAGDDLVLEVEVQLPLLVEHQLEQVREVLGVERRGVVGHLARQVDRADDLDAVLDRRSPPPWSARSCRRSRRPCRRSPSPAPCRGRPRR